MAPGRQRLRNAAINTAVALVATVLSLLALEYASRWLVPLSPGTQVFDVNGTGMDVVTGNGPGGRPGLRPDFTFRQVSPDFDVVAHTGPLGLRAPEPRGDPAIVFVGDSFTFGQGLVDAQTIPAVFCAAARVECANLGQPGSGTLRQMDNLSWRLREHDWRPREVKLIVFAMSSSMMAGNDFEDTLAERNRAESAPVAATAAQGTEARFSRFLQYRQWLRVHSNLARVVYLWFGPTIRTLLSPPASAERLEAGVSAMAAQLEHLRTLSAERGFNYTIYVLYPIQDLLRGTYPQTLEAVRRAAGGAEVVDTAPAVLDNPKAYYFPYDGHLNAEGVRRVAAFLLREDGFGT